jgi:glucosamine--fructose-6-phosphate aminotransferase (isomerizing)
VADLHPNLFLADVFETPAALARLGEAAGAVGPLGAGPVLFLGMGSSRYAALSAAAVLGARGVDAHVEYASTGAPRPPSAGMTVVAISAGGGSAETVAAARRHVGTSRVIAVTNAPGSELASLADDVVDVRAGLERSGVACRSFTNTLAALHLMAGADPAVLRVAADACAAVVEGRGAWLGAACDALAGRAVHVLAPAERIGSAEQGALMLREVPRVRADACETGDWSHVDVYLSRRPGLGLVLLRGSPYEAEALRWAGSRGCPVVAPDVPGGADPIVRSLVEGRVCELVAAELYARHGDG